MNREQFIAKWMDAELPNDAQLLSNDLDIFIAAAVAAEREACAQIADRHENTAGMNAHDWHECGQKVAAAIRARNDGKGE